MSTTLRDRPSWGTRVGGGVARSGPPVVLAVAGIAAWWGLAAVLDSSVVPDPLESLRGLRRQLDTPSFRTSIVDTVRVLAISYAVAAVLGAALGTLLGVRSFWSRALLPLVYALNSVPKVTLFPIFLLVLGLGDLSRGAFAVLSGLLPMFILAAEATRGVPRSHLKLASSLQVGELKVMSKIVWPSALPAIASGLRLTFGFTFLGLLVAEMFAGSSGLGQELLHNVSIGRMEYIAGEIVLIAVIALVPTAVLTWIERWAAGRYGYVDS
jgi:NitT/TauT family transport system permease protein